jgi:hypothetical protein
MDIKEQLKRTLAICYNLRENIISIMKNIDESQHLDDNYIKEKIYHISKDLSSIMQYIKSHFSYYMVMPENNINLNNNITELLVSKVSQSTENKEKELNSMNIILKKNVNIFDKFQSNDEINNKDEDFEAIDKYLSKMELKLKRISDKLSTQFDYDKIIKQIRQNNKYFVEGKETNSTIKIAFINKAASNNPSAASQLSSEEVLKLLNK